LCRDGVTKTKAQLELNLTRDAKNNKGFYRCVSQKRKVKESICPLMSKTGELVTMDKEKNEVLNFFCLSLHWQPLFPHLLSGWTARWDWGRKVAPIVRQDQVHDYLRNLNI